MSSKLITFKNAYVNYMQRRAKTEVYKVLINQSDRALKDMGISRDLLAGGVRNWPWAAPAEDGFTLNTAANSSASKTANAPQKSKQQQIAEAIRELNTFSDRQLHDLGIDRGMIQDAVVNGRYGIDTSNPIQAASAKAAPAKEVIAAASTVAKIGNTQGSANDTDRPQPPMTPTNSGGGSRQAA